MRNRKHINLAQIKDHTVGIAIVDYLAPGIGPDPAKACAVPRTGRLLGLSHLRVSIRREAWLSRQQPKSWKRQYIWTHEVPAILALGRREP